MKAIGSLVKKLPLFAVFLLVAIVAVLLVAGCSNTGKSDPVKPDQGNAGSAYDYSTTGKLVTVVDDNGDPAVPDFVIKGIYLSDGKGISDPFRYTPPSMNTDDIGTVEYQRGGDVNIYIDFKNSDIPWGSTKNVKELGQHLQIAIGPHRSTIEEYQALAEYGGQADPVLRENKVYGIVGEGNPEGTFLGSFKIAADQDAPTGVYDIFFVYDGKISQFATVNVL